jgi:hypothetical protein
MLYCRFQPCNAEDKSSALDLKKIAAQFKVLIHTKTIMAPQTPSRVGIL